MAACETPPLSPSQPQRANPYLQWQVAARETALRNLGSICTALVASSRALRGLPSDGGEWGEVGDEISGVAWGQGWGVATGQQEWVV